MSSAWEDTPTAAVSFEGTHIIRPVDIDDDESNIKDNWDDEEEAPPAQPPPPKPVAKQPKPKKDDKKKNSEKEPVQLLTPEQLAAQRAEDERRVREVDLQLAKEMLGTKLNVSDVSFTPSTQEEFDSLNGFLVSLISTLSGSAHFPEFVEKFTREMAVSLDTDVLKKMSEVLSAVLTEKSKQQQKKTKKSGKGIKLRVGDPIRDTGDEDLFGGANEDGEEDYDDTADKYDFM